MLTKIIRKILHINQGQVKPEKYFISIILFEKKKLIL